MRGAPAIFVAVIGLLGAGCASLSSGARDYFARVESCPPERVTILRRPDVAAHTVLASSLDEPAPDVAADPERLAYFRAQVAKQNAQTDDLYPAVYEATGCGRRALLACTRDAENTSQVECLSRFVP